MYPFEEILITYLLWISISPSTVDGAVDLTNIQEKGTLTNISLHGLTKNTSADNIAQKLMALHPALPKNNSLSVSKIASEGGVVTPNDATHIGREHVIESPRTTKPVISKVLAPNSLNSTDSEDIKPVNEAVINDLDIAPQKDDEKPSVPKKGVSFNDVLPPLNNSVANVIHDVIKLNVTSNNNTKSKNSSLNTVFNITNNNSSNNYTSIKPVIVHKKPLVTESDDDNVAEYKSKTNSKENPITVDQIDPLLINKKSNRSDYIVPIVGVILSVPLVAILISMLYKRGTDWWQHRNYKRMDFLIEGMYN